MLHQQVFHTLLIGILVTYVSPAASIDKLDSSSITCNDTSCEGAYTGVEFHEGSDIAHQFSNHMCRRVGDQLKALYRSGHYAKVDLENIEMSTKGMGSGKVVYKLVIPFERVSAKCDAYTSFDHVGGWGHAPALAKRKGELKTALIPGDSLNISTPKTTPEGLQEYWIQWRNRSVQAECQP